jgi:hypothetical protein
VARGDDADGELTFNLRDFPDAALAPYGIRAIHPDAFVEHLLDLNSEMTCEAIKRIRGRLANPRCSAEEMIVNYQRNGLVVSASLLQEHLNWL